MNIDIDIDVDEIIWRMNTQEKKEMLRELLKDMNIKDVSEIIKEISDKNLKPILVGGMLTPNTPSANKFNEAICGLINKSWRLTIDDENQIIDIASRYS